MTVKRKSAAPRVIRFAAPTPQNHLFLNHLSNKADLKFLSEISFNNMTN